MASRVEVVIEQGQKRAFASALVWPGWARSGRDEHAALAALRRAGIRVSVDDFGTGYGSLGLLQQLPVDALKVDRSFVERLLDDPGAETITATILSLASAFGLEVVAEGIERPEQHERLRAMGCTLGQGYLFSRPLVADELRSRILEA